MADTLVLFNAALTAGFVSSNPFLMQGERVTIDFDIVSSAGPTAVEWYLEFADGSENPLGSSARWRREVAEEDAAGGIVSMPKVVRTFKENGGANLADGTHRVSCQFQRSAQFCRFQIRASAGAAVVRASAPFGGAVNVPL